jgi:predicted PurR-regulated permease PerM
VKEYTEAAVQITSSLLAATTKIAAQIIISLVLSFMVLWDLPRIRVGIKSLESSRLRQVYSELAPPLGVFGQLFGKALQAQARIAFVNTVLTALGMWILKLPGVGLLSLFVFVCGFIPIAGVFISTGPIAFIALTEYGFLKLALVILMVTAVHFVEAYMLNPVIYSSHLKLHPLLVLSVLVVAEHSLGFWGLLLAVPSTVFALDYCIRYPDLRPTEIAQQELRHVDRSVDYDPHPILP